MASTGKPVDRNPGPTPEPQPAASSASAPASAQLKASKKPSQTAPALEPWMRQTVVLKLKEVDGRVPDMSHAVFCKKMVVDQGFSKAETLGIDLIMAGLFYITFATVDACRRYWEVVKTARPESPFSRFLGNCPIQREERRVTVSMRNPHTPGKDIATFLKRYCTVVKDPSHILNSLGFWTCKWSVIVRLNKDPNSADGLQHLPPTFSLGNSFGLIYYPDMPQTCRRCGKNGHQVRDCKEDACRNCRVVGHGTKDCPKKKTCNLCGLADHVYRDCPQRERAWATVAAKAPGRGNSAPAPTVQKPKADKKKEGKRLPAPTTPAPTIPSPPTPAPTLAPTTPSPPAPTPRPPAPLHSLPATHTEESTFLFPLDSVVLSPAPLATLPPYSPGPAALTAPPAALDLSLEEFPPLVSSGATPRKGKRKVRDSPTAETSKKKVIETCEEALPDDEEMDQIVEDLVAETEFQELPDSQAMIFKELVEECLLDFTRRPTDTKEEDPPDLSGN